MLRRSGLALLLALACGSGLPAGPPPARGEALQTRRYLCVRNTTDEVVTVRLRYRTEGKAPWKPGPPGGEAAPLTYTVRPGQTLYLEEGGSLVAASHVRLWAASASTDWTRYRDKDIDLSRPYPSACLATFTFRLSK